MPEALRVSAPATSANLGPGFDALAVALDVANEITLVRRPGPLTVRVVGEGAGELRQDEENLLCRALAVGLGSLDGLEVECRNRIPLGRGLGSSAAAVCAGLVAANALGALRWSPDDILDRATELEGHADNAAACLAGGFAAVAVDAPAVRLAPPEGLAFLTVVPPERVATEAAREALPQEVRLPDAADSLARAVGLVLALAEGRLHDLPCLLHDRLHEPHRAPLVPALAPLRRLAGQGAVLGATISGSGPSVLVWCRAEGAAAAAAAAREALASAAVDAEVRVARAAPAGVSARWMGDAPIRLAGAIG